MDFLYLFHAINFQKGFLLIAILILILTLLVVGYNAKYQANQGSNWSPTIAPCPDYWDVSGAFCINTTGKNIGHGNRGGKYNDYNWTGANDCNIYNLSNDPKQHHLYCVKNDITTYVIPQHTMSVKLGSVGHRRYGKTKNSRRNWAYKFGFMWDGLTSEIT